METALYGPRGFFRRAEGPGGHFRTSASASVLFAEAVLILLHDVDAILGSPAELALIDMGAGRGELLLAAQARAPESLRSRLRLHAVERVARPEGLSPDISWSEHVPAGLHGLLLGNEWLDNVAFEVVERRAQIDFLVHVDPLSGREELGAPVTGKDAEWLRQWWPSRREGDRAEIGRCRDEAWADALRRFGRGLAVAVDYATTAEERAEHFWPRGTMTAYRRGRSVPAVPDGSCDVTAAVALDACAAVGRPALGAEWRTPLLTDQRTALRLLGVGSTWAAAAEPGGASSAMAGLRALQRRGELAELSARGGLGDFGWLLQPVRAPLPDRWKGLAPALSAQPDALTPASGSPGAAPAR